MFKNVPHRSMLRNFTQATITLALSWMCYMISDVLKQQQYYVQQCNVATLFQEVFRLRDTYIVYSASQPIGSCIVLDNKKELIDV